MLIKSENSTPAEFVWRVLERDVRNIYRAQQLVVSQRIYLNGKDLKAKHRGKGVKRRTGTLENSLTNPNFFMRTEGESFTIAANYPIYIRFLDMKSISNLLVYNKQIWGILTKTYSDLKFRYGEHIADVVGEALRSAFEKYKKK